MRPADVGFGEPTEWITAGHVFDLGDRQLEAIATPGHTRGHLVFADRAAGLLFAGDHVLPHITPSIAFEEAPPELPLRDYLESLNVVRRMPDMTLLPAHGPVAPSAHGRVDELIAHHDDRLAAMAAVLSGRGPLTAYQVAAELPWTSRKRQLSEMDPMNKMLAICETAYHLDLLVAQGPPPSVVADGIRRYELTAPGPRDVNRPGRPRRPGPLTAPVLAEALAGAWLAGLGVVGLTALAAGRWRSPACGPGGHRSAAGAASTGSRRTRPGR